MVRQALVLSWVFLFFVGFFFGAGSYGWAYFSLLLFVLCALVIIGELRKDEGAE